MIGCGFIITNTYAMLHCIHVEAALNFTG